MKRRIWTSWHGTGGCRRARRGTRRDGCVRVTEARSHADATGVVVKASLDAERRSDGERRDLRARREPSSRRRRRRERCSVRCGRSSRRSTWPEPTCRSKASSSSQRRAGCRRPSRRRASDGAMPLATWVMVLTAAGQTLNGPDVSPRARPGIGRSRPGATSVICLPPPDVPLGTPGRATFGAKVYSAELTINGVFSRIASRSVGLVLGAVHTRLRHAERRRARSSRRPAIAPGAVTLTARTSGAGPG